MSVYEDSCTDSLVKFGLTVLIDINECVEDPPCNPNADCTNTNGSYTCACMSGFSGNGEEVCTGG